MTSAPTLKVIAFDLDDTLWPLAKTIHQANEQTWNFLVSRFPDINKKFSSNFSSPTVNKELNLQQYKHQITKARLAIMHYMLVQSGASDLQAKEISTQAMDVFLDYRHRLTFYPGALTSLKNLKKHYKLASMSNGNASVARIVELDNIFDFSINAEDINSSKPQPDLFLSALDYFKCSAHEMLYIGDHLDKDVFAAQALGINALWFNWNNQYEFSAAHLQKIKQDAINKNQAPQQVHNFAQLEKYIQEF